MYLICAFKVDFCFFEDLCLCVCVKKTFIHRKYTNGQQTSVILVIDKYQKAKIKNIVATLGQPIYVCNIGRVVENLHLLCSASGTVTWCSRCEECRVSTMCSQGAFQSTASLLQQCQTLDLCFLLKSSSSSDWDTLGFLSIEDSLVVCYLYYEFSYCIDIFILNDVQIEGRPAIYDQSSFLGHMSENFYSTINDMHSALSPLGTFTQKQNDAM